MANFDINLNGSRADQAGPLVGREFTIRQGGRRHSARSPKPPRQASGWRHGLARGARRRGRWTRKGGQFGLILYPLGDDVRLMIDPFEIQ